MKKYKPGLWWLLTLGVAVQLQAAITYDANNEFALGNGNPNGVWTYGAFDFNPVNFKKMTVPFNWLTRPDGQFNIDAWSMGRGDPQVTHNATGAPVTAFGFTWGVNDIGLDSYAGAAIIQWTAPSAGTVLATATFSASIATAYEGFNGAVTKSQGNSSGTTWSDVFVVKAGDIIEFATSSDPGTVTMFRETITYTLIPEPAALGLLVLGGLALFRRQRR
jgi:hypothetical protein